ncbi:MAG: DUF6090 family protein [Maribacter sp.]|nr:DUF6090 family protein [Maribacter sp.]
MIPFFRKIRKKLADENKPLKYMRYAIGEIVLVVIGILIALQVNNWNTVRSEEKELNEYLLTIAQNIKSDLPVIQNLKNQRDSVTGHAQEFWPLAHKDYYDVHEASFLAQIIISSFEVENFNCNQSGFESMKTSGLIGKIQGTDLAESIFEYYRKAGIINNLVDHANTYSQAMQIDLMTQEFSPEWGRINGFIGDYLGGTIEIDPEFWQESQITLKKVSRHPAVFAMMARHGSNLDIQVNYGEIKQLGARIIQDIETKLKTN